MRRYIIDKNKVFGILNYKEAKKYVGKKGYFTRILYGRSSDEIVEFHFGELLSIAKNDELSRYVYMDTNHYAQAIFIPQENVEIVIDNNSPFEAIVEYKVFQFLKDLKDFTDITKYISFEDFRFFERDGFGILMIPLTQTNGSLILRSSRYVLTVRDVRFDKALIETESIIIDEEFEKLKTQYERYSEFVKAINEKLEDLNKMF